jgi:hypothetical protein
MRGSHHDAVNTTLRIAVGTELLGLGGCTPSTSATSNDAKKAPPTKTEAKVYETVNEGPVDPPPKVPEAKTPDDGGCQPPDCHINPGPNDDPNPKPIPKPEPEPKRVNTGPVDPPKP